MIDIARINSVTMAIVRTPKQFEQLCAITRTSIYLEVKGLCDKLCTGAFTKSDSARMALELTTTLCGEPSPSSQTPLTFELQRAIARVLAQIKGHERDIKIAASFMRWSRAVSLLMKLRNDEAERCLNGALELNPDNALAYCSLAYLAGFRGKPRKAMAMANRALALKPDLSEACVELGNACEALGDHIGAQAAWQKANALKPDAVVLEDRQPAPADHRVGRDGQTYEVLTEEPQDE